MSPINKIILKALLFGLFVFTTSCKKKPNVCFSNSINYLTTETSSHVGTPVDFITVCDRDANKYEWDFGDGTPIEIGTRVTHTFTAAGTYTITLTGTIVRKKEKNNTFTVVSKEFTIEP